MRRSALVEASACESVLATTNSTPCNPASIILLTALQPAPPTPKTVILGFSSVMSGVFKLMLIVRPLRLSLGAARRPIRPFRRSETVLQPPPHSHQIPVGPRHQSAGLARPELLDLRGLRIDHQ